MNPRPTTEEIGGHYPVEYPEHTEVHSGNPFGRAQADIIERYFEKPGAVLDVGCASGAFLRAMGERGWRLAGADTSEQACKIATTVPGIDLRIGPLQRSDFPSASFDAITLWSVLEHLHDPLETLRIARDAIKPGGRLFMLVPNYRGLERMLFRTHWFALDLPRHLYHFTPDTLTRMLEQGGFTVEKLAHASGHDGVRFSLRLLAGKRVLQLPGAAADAGRTGAKSAVPDRAARKINGAVVGTFTSLADKVALGSQLLVVSRPSPISNGGRNRGSGSDAKR